MGQYFEITGHNNMTVETGPKEIQRNLYAKDNRICFFNGMVIGEFATPERAAEVWKDLKQAALDGEESFTLPQV